LNIHNLNFQGYIFNFVKIVFVGAIIKAISFYLPEKSFSNEDYFREFPDSRLNENLKKLAIENRFIVSENEIASDLALSSAIKLFDEHQINREEIDFIIFCAQEFDFYTPTTACTIQAKLGLRNNCGAIDVNLGCSGFVYGLNLAKGLIDSDSCKNVLLLTSSTLTKTFHPNDKSSRYLFGDGAAATLISSVNSSQSGIGKFVFGTDGSRFDKIIVRDGGARNPINENSFIDSNDGFGNISNNAHFFMDGIGIFNFALKTVPDLIFQTLEKNGLTMEQIDYFVLHQTNFLLNESIRKKMNIKPERMVYNIQKIGNTVSSTIPIAIKMEQDKGKIKKDSLIVIAGFGTGLSWSATVIKI
jgi:3-oxoacyl-[acyl-carrier-protein] synthase-3